MQNKPAGALLQFFCQPGRSPQIACQSSDFGSQSLIFRSPLPCSFDPQSRHQGGVVARPPEACIEGLDPCVSLDEGHSLRDTIFPADGSADLGSALSHACIVDGCINRCSQRFAG